MTQPTSMCQFLDWDSSFFGCRIARVTAGRLGPKDVHALESWCAEQEIDCVYFLGDAGDPGTIREAERSGFELMDIRVTLGRSVRNSIPEAPAGVRLCKESDIPALSAIARESHSDSRFYADSHFPRARCADLYETWIVRSCHGYADAVLVAEHEGDIAGYVSCHVEAPQRGTIGLIAVSDRWRGCGIGRRLVDAALLYLRERNVSRAGVVTQGRNIASQCLYQACGFRTEAVQLWYHRWFAQRNDAGVPA
jgi:dTDP-4-amino-4,6-dideoxy-D-galactose acyltransferase